MRSSASGNVSVMYTLSPSVSAAFSETLQSIFKNFKIFLLKIPEFFYDAISSKQVLLFDIYCCSNLLQHI